MNTVTINKHTLDKIESLMGKVPALVRCIEATTQHEETKLICTEVLDEWRALRVIMRGAQS